MKASLADQRAFSFEVKLSAPRVSFFIIYSRGEGEPHTAGDRKPEVAGLIIHRSPKMPHDYFVDTMGSGLTSKNEFVIQSDSAQRLQKLKETAAALVKNETEETRNAFLLETAKDILDCYDSPDNEIEENTVR